MNLANRFNVVFCKHQISVPDRTLLKHSKKSNVVI